MKEVKVKVLITQSFLTLCNPIDSTQQAPLSKGILQARILEWVAMTSSRGFSQPRDGTQVSCIVVDTLLSEPPGKPDMEYKYKATLPRV